MGRCGCREVERGVWDGYGVEMEEVLVVVWVSDECYGCECAIGAPDRSLGPRLV